MNWTLIQRSLKNIISSPKSLQHHFLENHLHYPAYYRFAIIYFFTENKKKYINLKKYFYTNGNDFSNDLYNIDENDIINLIISSPLQFEQIFQYFSENFFDFLFDINISLAIHFPNNQFLQCYKNLKKLNIINYSFISKNLNEYINLIQKNIEYKKHVDTKEHNKINKHSTIIANKNNNVSNASYNNSLFVQIDLYDHNYIKHFQSSIYNSLKNEIETDYFKNFNILSLISTTELKKILSSQVNIDIWDILIVRLELCNGICCKGRKITKFKQNIIKKNKILNDDRYKNAKKMSPRDIQNNRLFLLDSLFLLFMNKKYPNHCLEITLETLSAFLYNQRLFNYKIPYFFNRNKYLLIPGYLNVLNKNIISESIIRKKERVFGFFEKKVDVIISIYTKIFNLNEYIGKKGCECIFCDYDTSEKNFNIKISNSWHIYDLITKKYSNESLIFQLMRYETYRYTILHYFNPFHYSFRTAVFIYNHFFEYQNYEINKIFSLEEFKWILKNGNGILLNIYKKLNQIDNNTIDNVISYNFHYNMINHNTIIKSIQNYINMYHNLSDSKANQYNCRKYFSDFILFELSENYIPLIGLFKSLDNKIFKYLKQNDQINVLIENINKFKYIPDLNLRKIINNERIDLSDLKCYMGYKIKIEWISVEELISIYDSEYKEDFTVENNSCIIENDIDRNDSVIQNIESFNYKYNDIQFNLMFHLLNFTSNIDQLKVFKYLKFKNVRNLLSHFENKNQLIYEYLKKESKMQRGNVIYYDLVISDEKYLLYNYLMKFPCLITDYLENIEIDCTIQQAVIASRLMDYMKIEKNKNLESIINAQLSYQCLYGNVQELIQNSLKNQKSMDDEIENINITESNIDSSKNIENNILNIIFCNNATSEQFFNSQLFIHLSYIRPKELHLFIISIFNLHPSMLHIHLKDQNFYNLHKIEIFKFIGYDKYDHCNQKIKYEMPHEDLKDLSYIENQKQNYLPVYRNTNMIKSKELILMILKNVQNLDLFILFYFFNNQSSDVSSLALKRIKDININNETISKNKNTIINYIINNTKNINNFIQTLEINENLDINSIDLLIIFAQSYIRYTGNHDNNINKIIKFIIENSNYSNIKDKLTRILEFSHNVIEIVKQMSHLLNKNDLIKYIRNRKINKENVKEIIEIMNQVSIDFPDVFTIDTSCLECDESRNEKSKDTSKIKTNSLNMVELLLFSTYACKLSSFHPYIPLVLPIILNNIIVHYDALKNIIINTNEYDCKVLYRMYKHIQNMNMKEKSIVGEILQIISEKFENHNYNANITNNYNENIHNNYEKINCNHIKENNDFSHSIKYQNIDHNNFPIHEQIVLVHIILLIILKNDDNQSISREYSRYYGIIHGTSIIRKYIDKIIHFIVDDDTIDNDTILFKVMDELIIKYTELLNNNLTILLNNRNIISDHLLIHCLENGYFQERITTNALSENRERIIVFMIKNQYKIRFICDHSDNDKIAKSQYLNAYNNVETVENASIHNNENKSSIILNQQKNNSSSKFIIENIVKYIHLMNQSQLVDFIINFNYSKGIEYVENKNQLYQILLRNYLCECNSKDKNEKINILYLDLITHFNKSDLIIEKILLEKKNKKLIIDYLENQEKIVDYGYLREIIQLIVNDSLCCSNGGRECLIPYINKIPFMIIHTYFTLDYLIEHDEMNYSYFKNNMYTIQDKEKSIIYLLREYLRNKDKKGIIENIKKLINGSNEVLKIYCNHLFK